MVNKIVNKIDEETKIDIAEEVSPKRSMNKTKVIDNTKNTAEDFPFDKYFEKISDLIIERDLVNPNKITKTPIERDILKPEYQKYFLQKCKIRAAKDFNVTIEHLAEVYKLLNGKKIDGIYVNDLIDRFGFSDGTQTSRADLKVKYKLSSIQHIEEAINNLKIIVKHKDVVGAYKVYMNKYLIDKEKTEFEKEVNI